jgi:hypothetical protein
MHEDEVGSDEGKAGDRGGLASEVVRSAMVLALLLFLCSFMRLV